MGTVSVGIRGSQREQKSIQPPTASLSNENMWLGCSGDAQRLGPSVRDEVEWEAPGQAKENSPGSGLEASGNTYQLLNVQKKCIQIGVSVEAAHLHATCFTSPAGLTKPTEVPTWTVTEPCLCGGQGEGER